MTWPGFFSVVNTREPAAYTVKSGRERWRNLLNISVEVCSPTHAPLPKRMPLTNLPSSGTGGGYDFNKLSVDKTNFDLPEVAFLIVRVPFMAQKVFNVYQKGTVSHGPANGLSALQV